MVYLVVVLTAFVASGLTFFTGFGLGTLLLPAFTLFFPPGVAVALTAIAHFLNGLFKLMLVGTHVKRRVLLAFGVPAIIFAFLGAKILVWLSDLTPLHSYSLGDRQLVITPVKLVIAVMMFVFAGAELSKRVKAAHLDPKWMPVGGAISGFFGGLSGHQGAFRSAFLIRASLDPKAFVATSALIAVMVDVSRLSVYVSGEVLAHAGSNAGVLTAATLAAFAGAFIGSRLLEKVTMRSIQLAVAGLLIVVACGLATGFL